MPAIAVPQGKQDVIQRKRLDPFTVRATVSVKLIFWCSFNIYQVQLRGLLFQTIGRLYLLFAFLVVKISIDCIWFPSSPIKFTEIRTADELVQMIAYFYYNAKRPSCVNPEALAPSF
jgi:hypothetical protein